MLYCDSAPSELKPGVVASGRTSTGCYKYGSVFPPPLITAVAQHGIKAVPPRMPAITSRQVLQKYPHSPIRYHHSSLPEDMTLSFSPSLSLLTTQTPAMIPLLSDGELFGTHLSGSCLEPKAADGVQI